MTQEKWLVVRHIHPSISGISFEHAREALSMDILRGLQEEVTIESTDTGAGREHLDWKRLQEEQAENMERLLLPHLVPGCKVAYFGATYIPLAIDLGFRVGSWHKTEVFLHNRNAFRWDWPGRTSDQTPPLPRVEGLPSEPVQAPGDVVVRMSVSARVHAVDTRPWFPEPLAEIDIHLGEHCDNDVLRTPRDLEMVVETFRRALKAIQNTLPRTKCIHLFAAVPVGLAFQMGQVISHTRQPVQTYKFVEHAAEKKYHEAIRVETPMLHKGRSSLQDGGQSTETDTRSQTIALSKIEILFISAIPEGTSQLRHGKEHRDIREELQLGEHRDRFVLLEPHLETKANKIQRIVRNHLGHILHFTGHANKDGELILHDQDDKMKSLPAAAVRDLFRLADRDGKLLCIVLNACHSDHLARILVSEPAAVRCAVGTTEAIHDDVAICFSSGFYGALGDGKSLEKAFEYGRNQVELLASSHGSEANRFVLHVADGFDSSLPLFPA